MHLTIYTGLYAVALSAVSVWISLSTGLIGISIGLWVTGMLACLLPWQKSRHGPDLQLFTTSPGGYLLLSNRAQILDLSSGLADFTGYCDADLPDLPARELLGADAWQQLQSAQREIVSGTGIRLDCTLPTSDGQRVQRMAVAQLLPEGLSKTRLVLVHFADLSSSNIPPSQLLRLKTNHQILMERSHDILMQIDTTGTIRYANGYTRALLGGKKPDLRGRKVIDFIEPADAQGFMDRLAGLWEGSDRPEKLPTLGMRVARTNEIWTIDARLIKIPSDTGTVYPGKSPILMTGQVIKQYATVVEDPRSSEARFSRIFHASPDAIVILNNQDASILDFNSSFTQLFGYSREIAIGETVNDLNLWEHLKDFEKLINRLKNQHLCDNLPAVLRTQSGNYLSVEISLRYIEIECELHILLIGRDVTARDQAEKARRESDTKFEQMFSACPDGICILRQADSYVIDINEAFLLQSGFARDEIVGFPLNKLSILEKPTASREIRNLLARNGKLDSYEITLRTKNGQPVTCLISASLLNVAGEPCVMFIAKNVSDLRDAEAKLRNSEQRFRGAFENSPIGILLVDMEGQIYMANRFAADLLAYDERQLAGIHISRLVPREDRVSLKDALERLIHSNELVHRTERRIYCQSGLELWTNFQIVLQRAPDNAPLYFIVQMADITEMKMSQKRMERMAFYDTLTDLANRRLFLERLEKSIAQQKRSGGLSALLYLDLDQFKRVNDTLGHEAGDMLLRQVAGRLTECVRATDTVGRPGGDEFTILLHNIVAPNDAGRIAEKILLRLREPITLSGQSLVVTTSIGIAILPNDGTDPNDIQRNADLAMYRAKERGRNNYQFYSEDMNTRAVNRLRTEGELRSALERSELELYYQPKVRLSDQSIVGAEALIRWNHPQRGLLSPGEFIDVAEETGAIVPIGQWLLADACNTGRLLNDQSQNSFSIAVNISPRQFRDPNLVTTIRRCLRESRLSPQLLELEITETMLMHDVEAASKTIWSLHDLGIKLAIDDFGTGYSSLTYLKKFPIDTVKVDRSFVMDIPKNPDDMAITAAVIAMAHQLNMKVVAEGVELTAQLDFLKQQNCEYAQGYLFSKPQQLADLQRMLQPDLHVLRN